MLPVKKGFIVESVSELPNLTNANRLFCDFETTSFDPLQYGNLPYHGHRICGIAVTADDVQHAWYVPVRHQGINSLSNLPEQPVQRWLKDVIGTAKVWANHNVKFDAHFAAVEGAMFTGELHDTVVRCKMIDSDRLFKGGYGLDAMSRDWLGVNIDDQYNRVKNYLAGMGKVDRKTPKDYGYVPIDILGEYAIHDVITNRALYNYCEAHKPEGCDKIWEIETKLTPVLFDMEHKGVRVDVEALQRKEFELMVQIVTAQEMISKKCGMTMDPWNAHHCYELLVNKFGLPVLGYTEIEVDDEGNTSGGNPSFTSDILLAYMSLPQVSENETYQEILRLLMFARDRNTLLTYFVRPYSQLNINGLLRTDYNQCVQTGRMSSKKPNLQQLSKEAKELIVPREGRGFMSYDASQIEFRVIVDYIQDAAAIQAYNENPDTDFHQWVADMGGLKRSPAKTINFTVAFGGGKKKVVSSLASNKDVVGEIKVEIDKKILAGEINPEFRKEIFDMRCKQRGEKIYREYHERLPGIKKLTDYAYFQAKKRGFVRTRLGRKRMLPEQAAWRAFNTVVHGHAADTQKDVTVKLAPRYNEFTRDLGIDFLLQVHDENLYEADCEIGRDARVRAKMLSVLEDPTYKMSVPVRFGCGYSEKNWRIASGDEGKQTVERVLQEVA